jgi:hypothetical protein
MSDLQQSLFIVQSPTRHSPSSEWMRYNYQAKAISNGLHCYYQEQQDLQLFLDKNEA